MKKYIICCIICQLFLIVSSNYAQDSTKSTITIKKSAFGRKYIHQDKKLKLKELKTLLTQEPATEQELSTAQKYYRPAMIFSTVGGFCIGWPIGSALGGTEDPAWELAIAGGGITIVALILGGKADKHFENAVHIYNKQIENHTKKSNISFKLYCSLKRIGLSLSF